MARTGNFGRQPRSAPSIQNTLIAIAREMQQQEDQNIMSAWQKGGSVDGVKVTDEMVLAHWRNRLKDISKDDPLADTYRNVVLQYEYAIAESKMTARYALLADPSAADDTAMSKFYLDWAKKVPQNSEFYRVLQRDAGQYIRAAKAKRDNNSRISEEKAYNARMLALEKKNELPGQSALKVITMLAQQGAVIQESPLGAETNIVNSTNIEQVGLPGTDQIMALLGNVTPEVRSFTEEGPGMGPLKTVANSQVLYTGEDGIPVTGADIAAMFKTLDPTFDGDFDLGYIRTLINAQRDGLQERIDLARETGHVSDMVQLQSQQAKVNEYGRQIAAWPVAQEYNDLHAAMQAVLTDNTLLPDAKVARIERIRTQMGELANDPRISEDTRMQTQLRAEAEGKTGVPTLAEDLTGTREGMDQQLAQQGDIKLVNDHLEMFQEQRELVEEGTHVMTQGEYVQDPLTGAVKFQPQTGGSQVGAATMADINNLPGAGKPVPVMVPNGDGGGATPMYVVPAPINATARGYAGEELTPTNLKPVGSFIRYRVNGVETTLYSATDPTTQQTMWTTDPPWDTTKVKTSFTQNGAMQVDFSDAVPQGVDLTQGANNGGIFDLGNGFIIAGARVSEDGVIIPGELQYDPQTAVNFTDAPRVHAGLGKDPYTDSFSASLAALKNTPDGASLLSQWTGDPRFTEVLQQNAHLAAGQTRQTDARGNETWVGGDPNQYANYINAANSALGWAKEGGTDASNPALRDSWWRDGTVPTPVKGGLSEKMQQQTDPEAGSLPSATVARGGADLQFSALAGAFQNNTMRFKRFGEQEPGLAIQTDLKLTVPAFDAKSLVPPTVATPTLQGSLPTMVKPQTVSTTTGYNSGSGYGGGGGQGSKAL